MLLFVVIINVFTFYIDVEIIVFGFCAGDHRNE